MGILWWILVGLVAGFLAKLIMPGKDPGGFFVTILIGIVGGIIGGYIGTQLGWGGMSGFNLRSILLATGGSLLLLFIYRKLR
ncbi:MAG: GlsB/YeaQ/YmgE family stress response membrane protein [Cyclobacteriaceae bacterium]